MVNEITLLETQGIEIQTENGPLQVYSSYTKFPHSWEKLMGKRVFWKFAKNRVFVGRKRFLDRGFLDLRFIAYIFWVFFRSRERPF
jgi:hypothetical protein